VTSDRKRKCSNGGDDTSVGCRYQSSADGDRCALSKSMVTVEHPIAVRPSSAVIAATPSAGDAVLRPSWSLLTRRHDTTHGEPQTPEGRPPTHAGYPDNNDKVSCLPVGVVDVWHKSWSSRGAPRLLIEPTLCRESVLPVLLLANSSCCQLSN